MRQIKYPKDDLENALKISKSTAEVLSIFNTEDNRFTRNYLYRIIKKFGLDSSNIKQKFLKYSKDYLENIVNSNYTIAAVIKELNLRVSGNNHAYIKFLINKYNINTSHFKGQGWKKNNTQHTKKITVEEILIRINKYKPQPAHLLRRVLIGVGIDHVCSVCNLGDSWNGKKLSLQIDHINGDTWDNKLTNIRFICPNCHSQTENFAGKGVSVKYNKLTNKFQNIFKHNCSECNILIKNKYTMCKLCYDKNINNIRNIPRPHKRKVIRPFKEELENLINTTSWVQIGKLYGVTDNAVKKWAKSYGIIWIKQKYTKSLNNTKI